MDREKINEILADAITDGKEAMHELADLLEELADRAQDAGLVLHEIEAAIETLEMEDIDEDSGKD